MQRVPGADPGPVVEGQRELRVEAEVGSFGVVVPLAEVHETGVGEDVLGVEALAPAGMGQDRIGNEARLRSSSIARATAWPCRVAASICRR